MRSPYEAFLESAPTAPFDPRVLEEADWDTLNSLAYKFQEEAAQIPEQSVEPLLLAASDGVSFQTHRAMKEAGVGPYGGQPAPVARAVDPWTRGKDDKVIDDWRERNRERQQQDYERLMRERQKSDRKLRG